MLETRAPLPSRRSRDMRHGPTEIEYYRDALDLTSIVAITDAAGVITYVNDKFCQISQYSREELLGKTHGMVNSGVHAREFFTEMWRTISSGRIWKGELCNRAKDGSLYWVLTTIIPFVYQNNKPYQYMAIRTDITESKNTAARLVEERAKVTHAEKMASLGEMAAGIAHELGNPLAAVRGRAEMLGVLAAREKIDQRKLAQATDEISALADRMTQIIQGMRTFARDASADPFGQAPLDQIVEGVLSFSREKFKQLGIHITVRDETNRSPVRCREAQISQVLVNLLNNACDAVANQKEKWIRIVIRDVKGLRQLSVTDSGAGIPAEIREKIRQPFFTTKKAGKGTGLGLSISQNILESHGGTLELDAVAGNTTFVISLPL